MERQKANKIVLLTLSISCIWSLITLIIHFRFSFVVPIFVFGILLLASINILLEDNSETIKKIRDSIVKKIASFKSRKNKEI
jgi:4-hydroxybenzoate polyprenyltransferase